MQQIKVQIITLLMTSIPTQVRMPLRIIVEIPQLSQMVPLKVMVFGKTELSINLVISITAMLFRILFIILAAISSLSQRNSI
ncbi:hypothetical protein NF29_21925 [Enterobacter cloacae]|nr:hypothetical protein NF29_21925 [Enterobacter cloacae]